MGRQIASHISTTSTGISSAVVGLGAARASDAVAHRLATGTVVFSECDTDDSVFEVVSGALRLHKILLDGRREIVGFVSGCRLLGVSQRGAYLYAAEVLAPAVVRRHAGVAFGRRIDQEPGLARLLLAEMCNERRAAQDQMLLLGRKSAIEKVASFLLARASDKGGDALDHVDLPMS